MHGHSSEGPEWHGAYWRGGRKRKKGVAQVEGTAISMGAEALWLKYTRIAHEDTACLSSAFPSLKPLGGFPRVLK